eukprot:COSAG01_NODE_1238_length_11092_cov_20.966433_3_plen_289_part_00
MEVCPTTVTTISAVSRCRRRARLAPVLYYYSPPTDGPAAAEEKREEGERPLCGMRKKETEKAKKKRHAKEAKAAQKEREKDPGAYDFRVGTDKRLLSVASSAKADTTLSRADSVGSKEQLSAFIRGGSTWATLPERIAAAMVCALHLCQSEGEGANKQGHSVPHGDFTTEVAQQAIRVLVKAAVEAADSTDAIIRQAAQGLAAEELESPQWDAIESAARTAHEERQESERPRLPPHVPIVATPKEKMEPVTLDGTTIECWIGCWYCINIAGHRLGKLQELVRICRCTA